MASEISGNATVCSTHCRDGLAQDCSNFIVLKRRYRGLALTLYSDVIMSAVASQITGVSIVCSTVCSGTGQRKHQSSASLAFVRGIHRWPLDFRHKGPVTPKIFIWWPSSCHRSKLLPFASPGTWRRHGMEILSILLVLCMGNPPLTKLQ